MHKINNEIESDKEHLLKLIRIALRYANGPLGIHHLARRFEARAETIQALCNKLVKSNPQAYSWAEKTKCVYFIHCGKPTISQFKDDEIYTLALKHVLEDKISGIKLDIDKIAYMDFKELKTIHRMGRATWSKVFKICQLYDPSCNFCITYM